MLSCWHTAASAYLGKREQAWGFCMLPTQGQFPQSVGGWFWDEPCYGASANALVPTASQTRMLSCKGDMCPTATDQGAWMGLPGCPILPLWGARVAWL